jgi:hypothetical protein
MTDFSDMVSILQDEFGESVTYTPTSGAASAVRAIPHIRRKTYRSEDSDRERESVLAIFTVSETVVAAPKIEDKITYDGVEYTVEEIDAASGFFDLYCSVMETKEYGLPSQRLRRGR